MKYCNRIEAACVCELEADHQGPHRCDCGGSWEYDEHGRLVPVTFPVMSVRGVGLPPEQRLYGE